MRPVQAPILAPWLFVAAVALTGCPEHDTGADGAEPDAGVSARSAMCDVSLPTSCPSPKPHYPDVQPIFEQRCVPCHNGATEDSPWPLTEYEHVADWYDTVRGDVVNCTMPPADAGVPMTDDERVKILTWIRCGFPK